MSSIEKFRPLGSEDNFSSKEEDILTRNHKFFSYDFKYVDFMLKIIDAKSVVSLRVLDWFIVNYSKKYNTCYLFGEHDNKTKFYVHNEYKNQLKGYSKKYFDFNCRTRKIAYHPNNDITFVTSIGQLNFFHWAIRNKVIKYVENNINKIELDMKESAKENKEKKLLMSTDFTSTDQTQINSFGADPMICSTDTINSIRISSSKGIKSSDKLESSERRQKRQQLSKSVYQSGMRKSSGVVRLGLE